MLIFDCNGVLVDSEPIAAAVAADEFARVGIPITPQLVTRYFFGRRPADMFAMVETATQRKLPVEFGANVAAATLKRLRTDLRAMPDASHALTWLRGPKCVASSSTCDRIRASLEITGLAHKLISESFRAVEVFLCAGAIYLAINFVVTRAILLAEARVAPDLTLASKVAPVH